MDMAAGPQLIAALPVTPDPAQMNLFAGEAGRDLALAGTWPVRPMVRRTVRLVPVWRPMRRTHDDDWRANDLGAFEITGAGPAAHAATMDSAPARLAAGDIDPEAAGQRSDPGISRSRPATDIEIGRGVGAVSEGCGGRPEDRGHYGREHKQKTKSHQSLHSNPAVHLLRPRLPCKRERPSQEKSTGGRRNCSGQRD
jgi:hypothetical protein